MAENRGVAYMKPGVVEVQSIDLHQSLTGIPFDAMCSFNSRTVYVP